MVDFSSRRLFGKSLLLPLGYSLLNQTRAQTLQALEKQKIVIAVGGKNLFYYLPLTIADQLGYFRDEGLQVELMNVTGGAKALQALVNGGADVVSGAYEHTIVMQAKGQPVTAFVLQGRAPQLVFAVSRKTMPNFRRMTDLRGKKIGITSPGSATNTLVNFVLHKSGMQPSDVTYVGVGTDRGAVNALRLGEIDAICNLDPVITILEQSKDIRNIIDTRGLKDTNIVFGGPVPGSSLYASNVFLQANPNTTQALTNAMVRALQWLRKAGVSDVIKTVPENYMLGDRALYIDSFVRMRESISPDGLFPEAGPRTVLNALMISNPELAGERIDLSRTYTNALVRKAGSQAARRL